MVTDSSSPRYKRGDWVRLTSIHPQVQEIGREFEAIQRRALGNTLRITKVTSDGWLEMEVYENGTHADGIGHHTHFVCTAPECVEPVAPLTLSARITHPVPPPKDR